jgi:hypothetical protein
MKKIFVLLSIALMANALHAYTNRVYNNTGESIHVTLVYSSCSDTQWLLNPAEMKEDHSGGCCLRFIRAALVSGPHANQWNVGYGSSTGSGMSCRGNSFTVKKAPNGTVVIETN